MNLRLPLLVLSLSSVAAGQAFSATEFGRSLKLPENSFEGVREAALLGQPLPREGVRLRSLGPLGANFLKTAFTDAPAAYGYRCAGEQEVVLLPGTAEDGRAFAARLLERRDVQPLYQAPSVTLLSAGGDLFARLSTFNGVLSLTTCRATRDFVTLNITPAPHEAFVGPAPYLVTGDHAGHLNWCTADETPLRRLQAFTGSTLAVDVSPDGTRVAAAGWDARPSVKLYDAATGALTQTLPLPDGPLALTFSGDAKTLLVLDGNQTYTWFDLASGRALNTWKTPSLGAYRLMGGASNLFLEWSAGSTLRVYDAQKGRPRFSLRNFGLSSHTFTPDGQWIVTASTQGVLSAYSTADGKPGPRFSLGVLVGTGLTPGQGGGEVVVLLRQNAEGKPSRVVASAWKVGELALTPRGTTEHRTGNLIVMNQARTAPASIAPCRAP